MLLTSLLIILIIAIFSIFIKKIEVIKLVFSVLPISMLIWIVINVALTLKGLLYSINDIHYIYSCLANTFDICTLDNGTYNGEGIHLALGGDYSVQDKSLTSNVCLSSQDSGAGNNTGSTDNPTDGAGSIGGNSSQCNHNFNQSVTLNWREIQANEIPKCDYGGNKNIRLPENSPSKHLVAHLGSRQFYTCSVYPCHDVICRKCLFGSW